jgi:hypothetical protein
VEELSAVECTRVGGVRETEMHAAESFLPEPTASDFKVAIRKLKSHKSVGADHIAAELIQAGGGVNIAIY